jgi:hypothetical protein
MFRGALSKDLEKKRRQINVTSVKLGAYLGEVIRLNCGGVWVKNVSGLPADLPVLSTGKEYAIPLGAIGAFLEGRPVGVGSSKVTTVTDYYHAVKGSQRAWLENHLYGEGGDREGVKKSMSPDPELAEELLGYCEMALLTAEAKWDVRLDFSEESIEGVENLLAELHNVLKAPSTPSDPKPTDQQVRNMVLLWGTYLGEVFRRHHGGKWLNTPIGDQGPVLRVELGSHQVFPLSKVNKRILNGPGDSVAFFYRASSKIVRGGLDLGAKPAQTARQAEKPEPTVSGAGVSDVRPGPPMGASRPRPRPGMHPPSPRTRQGAVDWVRHGKIAAGVFLGLLVFLLLLKPLLRRVQIGANEELAIAELIEFQTANVKFAGSLNIGGLVAPDIVADPNRYPIEGVLYLHPRFLLDTRNGYRFEFRGEELKRGSPIQPAYEFYVYWARPLMPGKTGLRTFAIYSSGYAVYARSDGELPTQDDTIVSSYTR